VIVNDTSRAERHYGDKKSMRKKLVYSSHVMPLRLLGDKSNAGGVSRGS
jgi:hypothetical protein